VQGERGGAEARQEQAGEATVERVRWPLEQAVEALVVLQQFQQQRECVGGLQAKKVRSAAFLEQCAERGRSLRLAFK
jgi:hypothetical protein